MDYGIENPKIPKHFMTALKFSPKKCDWTILAILRIDDIDANRLSGFP